MGIFVFMQAAQTTLYPKTSSSLVSKQSPMVTIADMTARLSKRCDVLSELLSKQVKNPFACVDSKEMIYAAHINELNNAQQAHLSARVISINSLFQMVFSGKDLKQWRKAASANYRRANSIVSGNAGSSNFVACTTRDAVSDKDALAEELLKAYNNWQSDDSWALEHLKAYTYWLGVAAKAYFYHLDYRDYVMRTQAVDFKALYKLEAIRQSPSVIDKSLDEAITRLLELSASLDHLCTLHGKLVQLTHDYLNIILFRLSLVAFDESGFVTKLMKQRISSSSAARLNSILSEEMAAFYPVVNRWKVYVVQVSGSVQVEVRIHPYMFDDARTAYKGYDTLPERTKQFERAMNSRLQGMRLGAQAPHIYFNCSLVE